MNRRRSQPASQSRALAVSQAGVRRHGGEERDPVVLRGYTQVIGLLVILLDTRVSCDEVVCRRERYIREICLPPLGLLYTHYRSSNSELTCILLTSHFSCQDEYDSPQLLGQRAGA